MTTTTEIVVPKTTEPVKDIVKIETSSEPGEIIVIANKPDGVKASLVALSAQMDQRIKHWKGEVKSLNTNLALAKKNKLRQEPVKRGILNAQRRVDFYTKLKAAFDAGYVPVPSFPGVDIFAVRVNRKKPKRNEVASRHDTWSGGSNTRDVDTDAPPVGEGRNVNVRPLQDARTWEKSGEGDKKTEMVTRWASDFADEIDFPFVLQKPEIVEATTEALSMRLFDELGVSPGRPGRSSGQSTRGSDPMIVGRVVLKNGPRWNWKRVSFLVGWYIDTKDL